MAKLLKKYLHEELSKALEPVDGAVVLHYQGLSASEEYSFRKNLRESDARMQVIKASIARVYLKEQGFSGDIGEVFRGPVAIVTCREEGGAIKAAKTLVQLVKDPKNKKIKLQGAIFDGTVMGADQVEDLSRLPSREQLFSRLAGAVQAPARNFASVLDAMNAQFASVVAALARKKEESEGGGE